MSSLSSRKEYGRFPYSESSNISVPANLDFEILLKKEGLKSTPEEQESLAYVCSAVVSSIASKRNLHENEDNPFFPVCSSLLQQVIKNYPLYLGLLVRKGILQTDRHFIPGEKCTGYRFSQPYRSAGLKTLQITSKVLNRRIIKARQKKLAEKSSTSGFRHLSKWWNKDLHFDQKEALSLLKQRQESLSVRLNSLKVADVNLVKELEVLMYHEVAIKNFCYPYRISRDDNSNRVHTNLTNLKKEFRRHITYKGKKLVSIDLKNSQPFLLLNILKPEFWKKNSKEKISISKITKGRKSLNSTYFTLSNIPLNIDYQRFMNCSFFADVCEGRFYEKIIEQLKKDDVVLTRPDVKIGVYKVLFGGVNIIHLRIFRVLQTLYPDVAEFILEMKKKYPENTLALLLQRLESFLVIDMACKQISKNNPQVPLFTIHDSIVTTEENQEYVRQMLSEIIQNYTGHKPSLDIALFDSPGEQEIKWMPVEGFDGIYQISEHGQVKCVGSKRRSEMLKKRIDRSGYYTVRLSRNGKTETHFLHRLIAQAFIPNSENKPWVNHLNGDKQDNSISNLEWTTPSENTLHAYTYHLIKKKGRPVVNTRTGERFQNIKQAALQSGIEYSTLRNYLNGSNPKNPTGFVYQNSTIRLPFYHFSGYNVLSRNGINLLSYKGAGVPKYFGDHI